MQMRPRDWEDSAKLRRVSPVGQVRAARESCRGRAEPHAKALEGHAEHGPSPGPEATREANSPKTRERPTPTRHSQPVHGHGRSAMQQKVAPGGGATERAIRTFM